MENNETKQVRVSFAAIDPYIETNIVAPTETKQNGRGYVDWGDRNIYPDYLLSLSKEASTLRSVITGTADFIVGDNIEIEDLVKGYLPGQMNVRGDQIAAQVRDIALDYETYGGFALQVIRSESGEVVEIHYIDIRFLRSNKDNSVFYYCEKWKEGRRQVVEYPAFYPYTSESWGALEDEEKQRCYSSILYVKNNHTQVYPIPIYCAAVKACETERCIDNFHLNSINNSFVSSMIINFNNGVPADEIKKEIEKSFNDKFSGHQNAGRICFSWNESRDSQTTISSPKVEDFGARYDALAKHVRQEIFTAFRANPNLFGIPTENLGFSQEEYESAFKLYNRTHVKPVQQIICDAYDRIYGKAGVLTITPFTLDGQGEKNVN